MEAIPLCELKSEDSNTTLSFPSHHSVPARPPLNRRLTLGDPLHYGAQALQEPSGDAKLSPCASPSPPAATTTLTQVHRFFHTQLPRRWPSKFRSPTLDNKSACTPSEYVITQLKVYLSETHASIPCRATSVAASSVKCNCTERQSIRRVAECPELHAPLVPILVVHHTQS